MKIKNWDNIDPENEELQYLISAIYRLRAPKVSRGYNKAFNYNNRFYAHVVHGQVRPSKASRKPGVGGRRFKRGIRVIDVLYHDTFFNEISTVERFYSLQDFNDMLHEYHDMD